MINIKDWIDKENAPIKMIMQVHDELVFEVQDQDADLLSEGVRFRMMSAASLDVPLVVDIGLGQDWAQAH